MDSFVPKSSFLEKVDYDETQYQMTVTFKGGKNQSKYLFVYPATWLSFKQSPDHSSFYSKAIKGKLLSVNIVKHTLGKHKNEPLKEAKIHRPQYRSKGGNKDDSRITGESSIPRAGKKPERNHGLIPGTLRREE